jgi:hypothetical protein
MSELAEVAEGEAGAGIPLPGKAKTDPREGGERPLPRRATKYLVFLIKSIRYFWPKVLGIFDQKY